MPCLSLLRWRPILSLMTTTAAAGSVGLVGRDAELAGLREELAAARGGGLRVAIVTGTPGIGKTRLLHEVTAEAQTLGFRVVEAAGSSLDSGLAYACLLPALERLVVQDAGALGHLPQLLRLFPGRAAAGAPLPTPVADPALEKTLLFEAVVRLFQRVTAAQPLLLAMDDLHWADRSTLELLHYMARRLADEPVMMLLARRAATAETGAAVRELVAALERSARTSEVIVGELDEASVMLLAGRMLGGEPPAGLDSVLRLRSAGVPLAVEGVLRGLLDSGALHRTPRSWVLEAIPSPLPQGLTQLVRDRLDHLGPAARAVVDLVSVSGGAIDDQLLAATAITGSASLDDALLATIEAGVLNTVGAEHRLALAHPMFQEVAYAELRPSRRAQLHARLAATLDRLTPEDVAARSLHHRGAGAAGDDAAALDVFLAAADLAARRSAPADASQQLMAALAVLRRGGRSDLLVDVLERLGEMQALAGDLDAAVQAWTSALEACTAGSPHGVLQQARLHRRLAQAERDRGRVSEAEKHVEAGFATLPDSGDSQERADLHHAAILVAGARDDHAATLVQLADRLGTPRARVQARLAVLALDLARGDLRAARGHGEVAIAAAERSRDALLINRAHSEMCLALLCLGDPVGLRIHSSAGLEAARRVGAPPLEAQIRRAVMLSSLVAGDLEQAVSGGDEAVDSARRFAPGRTLANNLIYRGWARLLVADEPGARADLDEAQAALHGQAPDNRTHLGLGLLAGHLALAQGDVAGALAAAARFRPGLDQLASQGLLDLRLPWGLVLLAEAQVAAGDLAGALVTATELERLGRGGAIGACFSLRIRAAAAAASGDAVAALAQVDEALAVAAALGARHEAARTMLAGAETAASAGATGAVERAIDAALHFDLCGARRDAERARRLVRRLGATPPQPHRRRARRDQGALGGRELEVAQLVAEGLTNAAIAERLFLSPRTVTSHLDHIYTRLGIRSRAALARRVTEMRAAAAGHPGAG